MFEKRREESKYTKEPEKKYQLSQNAITLLSAAFFGMGMIVMWLINP